MENYTSFAQVYDTFMDNVPYRQWAEYIRARLAAAGISDGLVLDLGCGTGSMTRRLALAGYDLIGVDASIEMLEIARHKQESADSIRPEDGALEAGILYLNQDIREFELYGTVRAVVSTCDTLNYITAAEDLGQVFRLVNNYLDPGGLFFFDFNTEYKYREVIGARVIAENRPDCSFIWDNDYDPETRINDYELTLFVRATDDLYRRFEETHYQKGYRLTEIIELLNGAGLEFVAAYDDYTSAAAHEHSERICVVAREQQKTRKMREDK